MTVPADPTLACDLLRGARDRFGRSPEEWLAGAFDPALPGAAVELRCAPASPSRMLTLRAVGTAERTVLARAEALARPEGLPVPTNALVGVRATMCLPALDSLDRLFAELRRVLRPTGTLTALVPSRPRGSLAELRAWWPLHRAVGGPPVFRNNSARDQLGWLFAAADFAVLLDQRRTFWVPVPDATGAVGVVAGLVSSGVWPADLPEQRLRGAARALARFAVPGRRLPIPLRLLVGRR